MNRSHRYTSTGIFYTNFQMIKILAKIYDNPRNKISFHSVRISLWTVHHRLTLTPDKPIAVWYLTIPIIYTVCCWKGTWTCQTNNNNAFKAKYARYEVRLDFLRMHMSVLTRSIQHCIKSVDSQVLDNLALVKPCMDRLSYLYCKEREW